MQEKKASIIVKNGKVLTMNAGRDEIECGVVAIDGKRIVAVGGPEILQNWEARKIIDADGGIVMPGMVNAHQHISMAAFRGLGEEGISNRLFAYFFPLENEKLSRDLIRKAAIHGCIEMASCGVTTFADMYYHEDEVAKAAKSVGMRGVLGETVIKFPTVDAANPFGGYEYAVDFIEKYRGDELVTPSFAPHATFTVPPEIFSKIRLAADELDAPILLHVAEFGDEAARAGFCGGSAVQFLDEIGFLNRRMLFAHCIHVSDADIELLRKNNVAVAYNPMANAKGATGIAPVCKMRDANLRVGIGTDGPMSSNQADIFRTMSYASSMQRLATGDRTVMTPDAVVEMATIGGARSLGLDDEIGSIEVGKLADIIVVETKSPNMIPMYDICAALVWQASGQNVVTTIVGGEILMENREFLAYDVEKDRAEMQSIAADIGVFAKELSKKAREAERR